MIFNLADINLDQIGQTLKDGGIGVMPSDTVYGIFTSALNNTSVENLYLIRKRDLNKPFIILISSLDDLEIFKISLNNYQRQFLEKVWPNPVSVILPCEDKRFFYLHRGTNSLSFRFPKLKWLQSLLKKSGPLVAPSANLAGRPTAQNIKDARKYFKNEIDFYIDAGEIKSPPSIIIQLGHQSFKTIRQGNFNFSACL